MRNISFRAKNAEEAGRRLEESLNADVPQSARMDVEKMQRFGDVLGQLLSLMPADRQVAVSISVANGAEPESEDGREAVRVRVATVTDRESGLVARASGADSSDLSVEVSSGDRQHERLVAQAEQDERDRLARQAQNDADRLRNAPPGAGVKPGDPVA